MTYSNTHQTYQFFGDSLIDRQSIVTLTPYYSLPAIGDLVTVLVL